jgi:hypothetical protein
MKNFYLLLFAVVALASTACKKSYNCKAVDSSGNEIVLTCEHCSKKDADDYEKTIVADGYVSADCQKK